MKAIIFLITIFFAIGCSAQKANFHALNKSGHTTFIIYGAPTGLGYPVPFASSSAACTASAGGIFSLGVGYGLTAPNGLPYIGQYVGTGTGGAGWYVHAWLGPPPSYTTTFATPAIVFHIDATFHIDSIVTC